MKQNTCFKVNGGLCIDLLITNSKFSFMKAKQFETGLSDHHYMIHAILKTKFENFEPKKSIHHNFKEYDNYQSKLVIFKSMSAMRTQAAFENNFVSIIDKEKGNKDFMRESKTPFE